MEWLHFFAALVLLGVGWNVALSVAPRCSPRPNRPTEQTKVQALTNQSSSAWWLSLAWALAGCNDRVGWATMNVVTVPMLVVAPAVALLSDDSALQLPELTASGDHDRHRTA